MPNSTDSDNRPTTLVDASDFDPVSLPRSFVRFSAKGLSAEARWVYVVLRANVSAGRQEHTVAEWAADAGFSTSTTRRALHELRDWGVISIAEQPVTATQYRPNEYIINPESHWRVAPVKESNKRKPGLPKKSGLPESAGLTNLVGKNLNTIPNTSPESLSFTTFKKEDSGDRDPELPTPILATRIPAQTPEKSSIPEVKPEDKPPAFKLVSDAPKHDPALQTDAQEKTAPLKSKTKKPTPVPPPPPLPHIAIIDAWHAALPDDVRPAGKPTYGRNVRPAKDLQEDGITSDDVTRFVTETYPKYRTWAKRSEAPQLMSLEHVRNHIRAWMSRNKPAPAQDVNSLDPAYWTQQPVIEKWEWKA